MLIMQTNKTGWWEGNDIASESSAICPSKMCATSIPLRHDISVLRHTCWLLRFACLQDEWPEDEAARQQIRADFTTDPEVGDRHQELVFIGQVSNVSHVCSLIIFGAGKIMAVLASN